MSVKLVTFLLLQAAAAFLAGVRSIPQPVNQLLGRQPRINGRIVGGHSINITQAPYQVSLANIHCGGSIISNQWILTAAHCIFGAQPNQIQVRLGSSENVGLNGQLLGIKKIVSHEKYNQTTYDYDFSLLELQEPIEFDETKQAVKLPKQGQEFKDGEMCYASGWGKTDNPLNFSGQLQQVQVPLIKQQECERLLYSLKVTDSMICAGYPQGGKNVCSGDSGGPLVSSDGLLVGVVSWTLIPCNMPNSAGVYGRVSTVREWIREHSGI
ncbi:hypothetical protein AWZ03_007032 [Drosophila navojoa]|uniref:trypsin n=1 Tax=Drosophila navojoa TaxID=7232 RepID=A0A484BD42_DRONA|nr:trypsin 3A1-like [Drosophila navojoa]TDG46594.1 hypothetical protein AWZ03_007032 [Drosophila navojoa]